LSRKDGVTDVILSHGEISLSNAIQKYEDKETNVRVDVLSAGSRVANPSELINKKSFETMLEELRKHYDLIFIDCCPISSMTDGVLVSKLADGTVYVIESERTDYPVIQTCIEELKGNNVTLLGAVLTKVNIKRQKKLYGYKYDYYYSNYNK
jgi:capsular exopolysaccharide synthesis family protein